MPHSVLKGAIPAEGLAPRLREIEETRTTGCLVFRHDGIEGSLRLVQGQLAMDQAQREDGLDPVELFLELRAGDFEVLQQLPPLPVSSGDDTKRQGSLQVHVAADLMNYCERAGLTGWLVLEHADGARAEIGYSRGELSGIRLQGPAELQEVFGWEEGHFEVEAAGLEDAFAEVTTAEYEVVSEADAEAKSEGRSDPTTPFEAARPPRRDETARNFLRVVEMTLAQIVETREQHRPASRTGPPLPPMPAARESVPAPAPRSADDSQSGIPTQLMIPIVYIDPATESAPPRQGLRHARRGDTSAEVVLPEAAPERRSHLAKPETGPTKRRKAKAMSEEAPEKAAKSAPAKSEQAKGAEAKGAPAKDAPKKELPASVWALIMLVVVFLALVTLSALPAMD